MVLSCFLMFKLQGRGSNVANIFENLNFSTRWIITHTRTSLLSTAVRNLLWNVLMAFILTVNKHYRKRRRLSVCLWVGNTHIFCNFKCLCVWKMSVLHSASHNVSKCLWYHKMSVCLNCLNVPRMSISVCKCLCLPQNVYLCLKMSSSVSKLLSVSVHLPVL